MPPEIAELIRTKRSIADNIAADMRLKIERGTYRVGSRLPGRRELASSYKVAPLIIQKAVNALVEDGLIRAENGKGTFVAGSTKVPRTRIGTVGIVAYVYPSWKGPGVKIEKATMIMQSVEQKITSAGGNSLYFNRYRADGNHVSVVDAVRDVVSSGADSIVFILEQDADEFARLADAGLDDIPMAVILWDECALPLPRIYYDSVDAGHGAATHLIDRGCRRILFFSSGFATWAERRAEGVIEAVRTARGGCEAEIRIRSSRAIPNALVEVDYMAEATEYAEQVFADGVSFDGVVAGNDLMAIAFAGVASAHGLQAGRDYALIGFDNDHEARDAGLSTMQPPWQQMGQEAVSLLQRRQADSPEVGCVRFRSHLIERQSSNFGGA